VPKLAVSDYKGVAYARKFPDSVRVYARASPFGYLEVYSSSYLHFAPGLSDNAAFNLPKMPDNAYLGLYIDGDGPSGIIRDLPASETAYYRFLPMAYPYLIKETPDTFVVQFGGGISTSVALRMNSRSVTVAEGNPTVLDAFRSAKALRDFTGDVLRDPRVRVIDYDGRLYLAHAGERYDVIDLSLADSAGLSSPGGFAIVEKFSYTTEAMASYMRALKDGGILAVTLWNKEEPPKSVLKLYATMAAAAREADPGDIAGRFFAAASYTSAAGLPPTKSRCCVNTRARCRSMRFIRRASTMTHCRRPRCWTIIAGRFFPSSRRSARRTRRQPLRRLAMRRGARFPISPTRQFRRHSWADWPGIISCTAAGMISRSAMCSTHDPSPTRALISQLTSKPATCRA